MLKRSELQAADKDKKLTEKSLEFEAMKTESDSALRALREQTQE